MSAGVRRILEMVVVVETLGKILAGALVNNGNQADSLYLSTKVTLTRRSLSRSADTHLPLHLSTF